MTGYDPDDPVCVNRMVEPLCRCSNADRQASYRGGWRLFPQRRFPKRRLRSPRCGLPNVRREIEIPQAERARSAAYVITAAEGAALHLDRLRKRAMDFDPAVRDRLIAGALVPAPLVDRAQKFRRWYRARVLELFKTVDVIIAPATPCIAPKLGQVTFMLDGVERPG